MATKLVVAKLGVVLSTDLVGLSTRLHKAADVL